MPATALMSGSRAQVFPVHTDELLPHPGGSWNTCSAEDISMHQRACGGNELTAVHI